MHDNRYLHDTYGCLSPVILTACYQNLIMCVHIIIIIVMAIIFHFY